MCCVVWSPEGPGWPRTGLGGVLQSQLGEGLPVLVTVSLREEGRGREKEISRVAATLKWGRRVEPSAARCSGLARTLLRTAQNPGREEQFSEAQEKEPQVVLRWRKWSRLAGSPKGGRERSGPRMRFTCPPPLSCPPSLAILDGLEAKGAQGWCVSRAPPPVVPS